MLLRLKHLVDHAKVLLKQRLIVLLMRMPQDWLLNRMLPPSKLPNKLLSPICPELCKLNNLTKHKMPPLPNRLWLCLVSLVWLTKMQVFVRLWLIKVLMSVQVKPTYKPNNKLIWLTKRLKIRWLSSMLGTSNKQDLPLKLRLIKRLNLALKQVMLQTCQTKRHRTKWHNLMPNNFSKQVCQLRRLPTKPLSLVLALRTLLPHRTLPLRINWLSSMQKTCNKQV